MRICVIPEREEDLEFVDALADSIRYYLGEEANFPIKKGRAHSGGDDLYFGLKTLHPRKIAVVGKKMVARDFRLR